MTILKPTPDGHPIKIVRDKTPELINSSGESGALYYGLIDDATEIAMWLRKKLVEEVGEYVVEPSRQELADVLAVVEGLAECHGLGIEQLVQMAREDERGGFFEGVMMYGYHPEFDGKGK